MQKCIVLSVVLALACTGCVGPGMRSSGGVRWAQIAMKRYQDVPERTNERKFLDYEDCVLKDNTSWPVLDACMLAYGYPLKEGK